MIEIKIVLCAWVNASHIWHDLAGSLHYSCHRHLKFVVELSAHVNRRSICQRWSGATERVSA